MIERDKQGLLDRTRARNRGVWVGLLGDTPLADQEAKLDSLALPTIEGYLAITDEMFAIKESQRDRTIEQNQAEIAQERTLADAKVQTERQRLAIKMAAEEYLLAARFYDAKVRSLIMAAKEYAAEVEKEQAGLEKSRAELAVAKEENRLQEINAKIFYEAIQKAQVEADLARAKVDVAKAHTRALMADIEAKKAELDLIDAEVQEAMVTVEKATLQADVALLYAEVVTKQLSEVKLAVEREEIARGFGFIQTKLDDLLAIWDARDRVEGLRTQGEKEVLAEILSLLTAEKAEQDLRKTEIQDAMEVFEHEVQAEAADLQEVRSQLEPWTTLKKKVKETDHKNKMSLLDKKLWAEKLINAAQQWVQKNHEIGRFETHRTIEYIDK